MKGIDISNLQQDLACITLVLEHWVPVLEQMEKIQDNLADLPSSLKNLRQQLNELDRKYNYSTKNSHPRTNGAENLSSDPALRMLPHRLKHLEMQTLINNLEGELPRLVFLQEKINNLIALKEILEALQERVQNKMTSAYEAEFQEIKDNLKKESLRYSMTRQQNLSETRQVNPRNRAKRKRNLFKKIHSNSTSENLGIGLTILFGFFLSWSIFNTFTSPNRMNPEVDATVIDADTRWERLEEGFYWED